MKTLLAILALSALVGCAPGTIEGLKQHHAGKLVFEIDQNYQPVYRAVIERARRCHEAVGIGAQFVVQGDLYTDLRSGNVTVALHGGLGVDTYMTIDITALADNKTSVETYYANGWSRRAQAVEKWVRQGSREC